MSCVSEVSFISIHLLFAYKCLASDDILDSRLQNSPQIMSLPSPPPHITISKSKPSAATVAVEGELDFPVWFT